jgi:sortase A
MTRRRDKITTVAVAAALLVAGLGVALYPKLTDLRYEFAQSIMAAGVGAASAAEGGIALPQDAVAHIEIPSIGVDAYVLEGTDTSTLNKGPGHYPDTPLPGQPGNAAIAGHRTMYGHVFHDLHELSVGDRILTGTREAITTYEVVEVLVVDDSQTEVVDDTEDDRLTLTTCHPIGSAAQRLVVVAVPSV